jgi:hypothetical protein
LKENRAAAAVVGIPRALLFERINYKQAINQ